MANIFFAGVFIVVFLIVCIYEYCCFVTINVLRIKQPCCVYLEKCCTNIFCRIFCCKRHEYYDLDEQDDSCYCIV